MARYGSLVAEQLLGLVVLLLLLRLLLSSIPHVRQTVIGFGVLRLTDWAVAPLSWLPRLQGIETAALIAALLFATLLDIIVLSLEGFKLFEQPSLTVPLLGVRAVLLVLLRLVQLYLVILICGVIFVWFELRAPSLRPTVMALFDRFLRPFRRIIPPFKGLDITPLVAVIIAQLLLLTIHDIYTRVSGIFT